MVPLLLAIVAMEAFRVMRMRTPMMRIIGGRRPRNKRKRVGYLEMKSGTKTRMI
jgi:hypothetical protein